MDKMVIDWRQFKTECGILAVRLRGLETRGMRFKGIVAVTRGGLVPAALLAQELEIRQIETICVSSYTDNDEKGRLEILKSPGELALAAMGSGWLVVDDLVDSGDTFRLIRRLLPAACFAVVYAKPNGAPAADVRSLSVPQDTWLVFPWETST